MHFIVEVYDIMKRNLILSNPSIHLLICRFDKHTFFVHPTDSVISSSLSSSSDTHSFAKFYSSLPSSFYYPRVLVLIYSTLHPVHQGPPSLQPLVSLLHLSYRQPPL